MARNIQSNCDCEAIHIDVVNRVRETMLPGDEVQRIANLYKAYADPTRIRILWALSQEDMCVCDLAVLLDLTKSAISHQLKFLRMANLVAFEKRGKIAHYSLTDDHVKEILTQGREHANEY